MTYSTDLVKLEVLQETKYSLKNENDSSKYEHSGECFLKQWAFIDFNYWPLI